MKNLIYKTIIRLDLVPSLVQTPRKTRIFLFKDWFNFVDKKTQEDELMSAKFREPPTGQCAYYNGKICKKHIHRQFWINNTGGNDGGDINEQISTGLWKEIIVGLEEPCRSAAEVCIRYFMQIT